MQKNNKPQALGQNSEEAALDFLQIRGLTLLQRNYRCSYGEIDLIMQEADEIVFIEVRLRTHAHYADAIESIDKNKQKKLLNSATHFLQTQAWLDKVNCRFDVIGFSNAKINWIKDAFSYE